MEQAMKKLIQALFFVCFVSSGADSMLKVTSSSFIHEEKIPLKYAYTDCGGDNSSPQLSWGHLPEGTQSIAIIVHDPDAASGHFIHWALYNLSPSVPSLREGVSKELVLSDINGAMQGKNDFGKIGYDGPCPPSGKHRYYFTVYALDANLDLPPGANARDVEGALKKHVLAQGTLMGYYRAQ